MPPPAALLRAQKAKAAANQKAGTGTSGGRGAGSSSLGASGQRGTGVGGSSAAGPSSVRPRPGAAGRGGDGGAAGGSGGGSKSRRGQDVKPDLEGEKDWADLMRKAYAGKEKIDENWYAKGIKTVEVGCLSLMWNPCPETACFW